MNAAQVVNMEDLKSLLKSFPNKTEEDLNQSFNKLAPYFLSGAYIKVRDEYRIYPTTVEFYFHSEQPNGIKDPIVYHRNNRMVAERPYFLFLSLHAHDSGYDITFENPIEKYRASVLIRAYQVWDGKQWLKWDSSKQFFRPFNKTIDKNPINTQVLYLKTFLNGFGMGQSDIEWIESKSIVEINSPSVRKGVNKYAADQKTRLKESDGRKWSFSRKYFIETI